MEDLGIIVGVFGAVLTVFIRFFDVVSAWRENRKNSLKVKKEIDDTIKEVEFINGWLVAVNNASNQEEGDKRRSIALSRLDHLMSSHQLQSYENSPADKGKSDRWFYLMSTFLGLSILGLFVDDEDNWSLTYFQNNFDSDMMMGLGFIFTVWVYFLLNSRWVNEYRKRGHR